MKPNEIKELRKSLDLTQLEFAVNLRTTPVTISRWERGLVRPHKFFIDAMLNLKNKRGV